MKALYWFLVSVSLGVGSLYLLYLGVDLSLQNEEWWHGTGPVALGVIAFDVAVEANKRLHILLTEGE